MPVTASHRESLPYRRHERQPEKSQTRARYAALRRVAQDKRLTGGCVRFYILLDQEYGWRDGLVCPKLETLEKRFGLCRRSCQRWYAQLREYGYLVTEPRNGRACRHRLSWAQNDTTEATAVSHPSISKTEINEADQSATDRPPDNYEEAERAALRRSLEPYRQFQPKERDGGAWDIEATARRVLHLADRLGVRPFAVAAYLDERWRYVSRRPDLWPQSPYWFTATVASRFRVSEANPAPTRDCAARAGGAADMGYVREMMRAIVAGVGSLA